MKPGKPTAVSPAGPGHWIVPGLCVVLLALALLRWPQVVMPESERSYQTVLYETLRLGQPWGTALVTTDGPLAALQTPGYVRGSLWMAMSWQIGGNLLLATVLVVAAFRLPWPRRWWAIGFLGFIPASYPSMAPWLVMMLLAHDLIERWDREPLRVLPPAGLLGFLALCSLGHLLLGVLALCLMLFSARPPVSKAAASLGFAVAFLGGWLLLGQTWGALELWLARTWPALWLTSPLDRSVDISSFVPWAVAGVAALLFALSRRSPANFDGHRIHAGVVFLLVSLWLSWKSVSLQPFGSPVIFFGTLLLVGFVLMHRGMRLGWVCLISGLSLAALIRHNPLLLTEGFGHLNQRIHTNFNLLGGLPNLRENLRTEINALRGVYGLPKIKAAVGEARVGVLGMPPGRALLNGLDVALAPVPLDELLRAPAMATLNGAWWEGPDAPAFVLQGLQSPGDTAPALINGRVQRVLQQQYELLLEESGHLLWRRKPVEPATPGAVLVAEGVLHRDEPLRLPAANDSAYWLELNPTPNLVGRLWSAVHELHTPGLTVHDSDDRQYRYVLPRAASAGFIVQPLLRGEVDFARRHGGQDTVRVTEIALVPPPRGAWGWKSDTPYRLYALPGPALRGSQLPTDQAKRFQALNRIPVGGMYPFPFAALNPDSATPSLLAHPPSLLEFILNSADRRVRGEFGILPGAYEGTNTTDGVDFSIEYVGPDGARRTLYHRYLDPLNEPADRGLQEFNVALPTAPGGRLFLRTHNLTAPGASWDWAVWRGVVIE